MKKNNLIGLSLIIVICVIVFLIFLYSSSEKMDIEVEVLNISFENNQYFVNISLRNNQVIVGWISDTYLETVKGNIIDLTGAGIDKKIEPEESIYIDLFSAEVSESITDSPILLKYTVFPSGEIYSVEI